MRNGTDVTVQAPWIKLSLAAHKHTLSRWLALEQNYCAMIASLLYLFFFQLFSFLVALVSTLVMGLLSFYVMLRFLFPAFLDGKIKDIHEFRKFFVVALLRYFGISFKSFLLLPDHLMFVLSENSSLNRNTIHIVFGYFVVVVYFGWLDIIQLSKCWPHKTWKRKRIQFLSFFFVCVMVVLLLLLSWWLPDKFAETTVNDSVFCHSSLQ